MLSLEEKPTKPKSRYAVPGLYVFDNTAPERARNLKPSARGELEIADLIHSYLADDALDAKPLGRRVAWLDTGTSDSLLEAANYIATVQHQGGYRVACLEEIALERGFIDRDQFAIQAEAQPSPENAAYLRSVLAR